MRIAFAGTPIFAQTQLQALLDANHDVVVVYTQADKPAGRGQHLTPSPVKNLAQSKGIPFEQPSSLKDPQALATLARYQPDVMIVAAYGLLLPTTILSYPRYGCINVHASLLPRWRGASPIQQAILAGDKISGITLMKMDEGLDTGPILATADCPVFPSDTAQDLHDRLAALGAHLLTSSLSAVVEQVPQAQDPTQVTLAPKISKEDAICRWSQPAIQIERQIRAFNPWPILHSTIQDQPLRLWHASVVPLNSAGSPGTIVAHTSQGIVIATGSEGLLLTHAQLPNKKILAMTEIIKAKQELFAVGQTFQ